jgi:hypothetical protein
MFCGGDVRVSRRIGHGYIVRSRALQIDKVANADTGKRYELQVRRPLNHTSR